MNHSIYLELRRRAEKRLTILTIWPLVTFQIIFYGLMLIRSPYDLGIPLVATLMSFCIIPATNLIVRRRTAANRRVRRAAIDGALEDAIEMGWPLEDPTPRQLRLLAALLDDDLETRAGIGRVMVWSSIVAAICWVLTYAASMSVLYSARADAGASLFYFTVWLAALGVFRWFHARSRRASGQRVQAALARAGDSMPVKAKRPAEAPWWRDEDDEPGEKLKHDVWNDEADVLLGDDGEISDRTSSTARG